ncbi:hypothetical protein [Limnoglobus roseus]|uniref:RNA polymerase sigma factor n=1 Tax=Limnoglobus roseus TaxID=2598579 RepID=A0A5C1AER1_9BACT|nr:hypothetical protein [Limnoglobus roseus]QEL16683.1 RNA polymerase sigma factor [Limnoglobus roseus]
MLARLLAMLAALFLAPAAHAEQGPGEDDRCRTEAEKAVTIQVTVMKTIDGEKAKEVTVEAKVLGVERSKAKLKKGDTVTIAYSLPTVRRAGPTRPPVLEAGEVYPAFLNKRDQSFAPAAAASSFRMTPEPPYTDKKAQQFGRAVLKVEELINGTPTGEKAEKLKAEVVGIGTGGDVMYRWIQARLGDEQRSLEAWIRDTNPAPEKSKELKAMIAFLQKVSIEIDAPK